MSTTPKVPVSPGTERLPLTLPALARRSGWASDRHGHRLRLPECQVAEAAGVDLVLVGELRRHDGARYPSTVPVSLDEMLMLASAVRRGLRTPLLIGDLPFRLL